MKHDLTVHATLLVTGAALAVSFETYPKDCTYLHFASGNVEFTLTASALKQNALEAIAAIPTAFGVTEGEEMLIELDDDYSMHIALDGNHIRFTQGEEELVYWVCDELQEESEIVMGAIGGYMCNPDALPR